MIRLIQTLIRPYKWVLSLVFLAMMVETLMSLAGPSPLRRRGARRHRAVRTCVQGCILRHSGITAPKFMTAAPPASDASAWRRAVAAAPAAAPVPSSTLADAAVPVEAEAATPTPWRRRRQQVQR